MKDRVFRRQNYWLHAPHLYLKNQMENEITLSLTSTVTLPLIYHYISFPITSAHSSH